MNSNCLSSSLSSSSSDADDADDDDADDDDLQGGMENQPVEAAASEIQPRNPHCAWGYVPPVRMIVP